MGTVERNIPSQTPNSIKLATTPTDPASINHLAPCLSKIGPTMTPNPKAKHAYMLKIHPISPSLYSFNWLREMYAWNEPSVFITPSAASSEHSDPKTTSQIGRAHV